MHETPAELTKNNNPCVVNPTSLSAALRQYPRKEGVFEAISFGIVAQCGSSSVSLGLPIAQEVDLERLQKARPEMARLWYLASDITEAVGLRTSLSLRTQQVGDLGGGRTRVEFEW